MLEAIWLLKFVNTGEASNELEVYKAEDEVFSVLELGEVHAKLISNVR
jgi:signal recognition particle GTPase